MRCVVRGKLRLNADIDECLRGLNDSIVSDLSAPVPGVSVIISALGKLGKILAEDEDFLVSALTQTGISENEAIEAKKGAAYILDEKQLYLKLKRELSGKPFEIKRISVREPYLGGLTPLGVLGHVTSSNDAMLPFLSAVEGLITGNINIVKTAEGASEVAVELAAKLCEIEPRLLPYIYVFPISSKETDRLAALFSNCDAVTVWGGENAVKGVTNLVPSGVPVIAWGHRISFAYVTKAGKSAEALKGISRDVCINEQQACSAPQIVYYEDDTRDGLLGFAEELSEAMSVISSQYPLHDITDAEQAELTSQTELQRLKEIMGDGAVIEGKDYRIYVGFEENMEASPLYRTILVKPLKRNDIIKTLRPYRSYLQSVGLAADCSEIAEIAEFFYRAGATRVTSAGGMANGYTGEPHDGVYALSRYVRRVSIENVRLPSSIMDLNEMRPMSGQPFEADAPILKKEDFGKADLPVNDGYLLLKSGGSTGKPVYAPHTYGDAETTYITAGCGMFSAGIAPGDVVMNLFYGGSMYGGFISMYEGLKYIDAIQLPMTSIMDFDFVTNEIISNNVNVVIGMPSYIRNLFTEKEDALKKYGGVEKILYGGEHMSPRQISWYMERFGVKTVKSLVYGCNEIGSIGYVCEHCEGTEHHLFGTMHLEILKMDCDEPVSGTEIGRIVLTPADKENIDINRYEIGDLGRFVTDDCPCGRKAPKFELLGRFGDTFKFATNYVNYKNIKAALEETNGYTGRLQLVLEYADKDSMKIRVDKNTDTEGFLDALIKNCPEINECLTDKTGVVTIVPDGDFVISSAGGKVRNVVDLRV